MLELLGFMAVLYLIYQWLTAKATATRSIDDALSHAQTDAFINMLETANNDPDSVAAHALREVLKENSNDQT